ncbi:FG-GAP repeat protein [Nitrospira sp. CMX1]
MTFPSRLHRSCAVSSLFLSYLVFTGCTVSGGGSSETLTQQAYMKASNTDTGDAFGLTMAMDGDTLVVGSIFEDSNATGVNGNPVDNSASATGAVYVFARANGVWSQQAYLKGSNTGAFDNFGSSVALSGDTLVVGAPGEDSNATGVNGAQGNNSVSDSGAVYVFTRTNGVWSQQAYLKASNTGMFDSFGSSVALSGDTLAVGAIGEESNATGINGNQGDNSASHAGAVYVFTRTSGVWSQQAYVKASNTEANDVFGKTVALNSDTLAVGALQEGSALTGVTGGSPNEVATGNGAANSGAVYVFTRTSGSWSQQAYVKASNTRNNDAFGTSLTLSGDTLAVGAPGENSVLTGVITGSPNAVTTGIGSPASGAVYIFTRTGGGWSQQAYVKASNTESLDNFGSTVALDGDKLAVGAYREDSNATGLAGTQSDNSASDAGAAYLFTRTAGVWSQQAYVKASNTEAGDQFGQSVALSGATLAVGSSTEDSALTGVTAGSPNQAATGNGLIDSGAVYVFQP